MPNDPREIFPAPFVESAHDPLEFNNHCDRHENRLGFAEKAQYGWPLPLGFRIIRIFAVKPRKHVGIEGDHGLLRLVSSAGSKSASRLSRPVRGSLIMPNPSSTEEGGAGRVIRRRIEPSMSTNSTLVPGTRPYRRRISAGITTCPFSVK